MTRLIDADKLYPDCLTKAGRVAISQSQIANAPTVEYPEAITIKCDTEEDKQKLLSALRNASARLELRVEEEGSTGKAIIRSNGDMSNYYICSECHKAIDGWDEFCRHCGARMEAEG